MVVCVEKILMSGGVLDFRRGEAMALGWGEVVEDVPVDLLHLVEE